MSGAAVFLCPGQGAQCAAMVTELRSDPLWDEVIGDLHRLAGEDPAERALREGDDYLRRNEISSLFTVLSSVRAARALHRGGWRPRAVMGYSIGQWSAMHVAGMLDLGALLDAVWKRAQAMNRCLAAAPGAMLAVIGLRLDAVEECCGLASRETGAPVVIANYNCPGQYSLSGTPAGIASVRRLLTERKAHKVVDIPVQGAWHCEMLRGAATEFRGWVAGLKLRAPAIPVISNVTGAPLPADRAALCDELAEHLASPVRWEAGVRHLIAEGATCFVETGFGNTLTKFGFFLDRSLEHVTWSGLVKGSGACAG